MLQRPRTWQYGYELSKDTGLTSGTLYPLLMRLSDQGFLESRWQETERPGKPPRHGYRLTSKGLTIARTIAGMEKPSIIRQTIAGATA
jgi:DNA-binding PadR family transcriptional regulator